MDTRTTILPDRLAKLIGVPVARLRQLCASGYFPKAADGRGYTTARLLRERYGYDGELRAFGDIGRDQIFFLHRVGFDAFVIGEGRSAEDALAAFDDFPDSYQGAADQPIPLFRRRAA